MSSLPQVGRLRLSGFVAWLLWWLVHIALLIGLRSKLLVMIGWIWSYLSFGRGARLITEASMPAEKPVEGAKPYESATSFVGRADQ